MHNFDEEVIIDLKKELKKGCRHYELPSLFGKKLKYSRKTYTHSDPAFTISYPEHFKVTKPAKDEALRVKCPLSSTPLFSVVAKDMPRDIRLQNIGTKHFTDELKKIGANVRLVSPNVATKGYPPNRPRPAAERQPMKCNLNRWQMISGKYAATTHKNPK